MMERNRLKICTQKEKRMDCKSHTIEMKKYMSIMKEILEDEMKRDDISFERIYLFSKDLTKLMLGEAADWYSQISTQKFTRL